MSLLHATRQQREPEGTTASATARQPNFVYLGTSKAGSTWLYHVLASHRQVYMAPAKGTYYFDSHFDRGSDWYLDHFRGAGAEAVIGEISHSYLFSSETAERILQMLPEARLMICLREPLERTFSAYLDAVKNGQFSGTFDQALEALPALKGRSLYAPHVQAYLQRFPRASIHVALFDDLKADPQRFADDLFAFLGIPTLELTPAMRKRMMPAARPRWRQLVTLAKWVARTCERVGWGGIRGRAKRSRLMRHLLYRPLQQGELPSIAPSTREQLREYFRADVHQLDQLLGTSLARRWDID